MRQFYLTYRIAKSPISQSLSWTHYIRLMRISDPDERRFYEIEAENNNWSVRELNRQFDSALYQRLAICRDKKDALVEITLPDETNPIFASRYQTVLPNKEELKALIEKK